MNKKIIIAAMITALSITAANASNITGITNGGSGTFDINPLKANGDVGYRYYDDFVLSAGDVANLIFKMQSGDQRAVETFINLVGGSNRAQILGILNSVDENGNFKNGHTVFMTKNGLTVGANGVVNVGTLSVLSPKFSGKTAAQSFEQLASEYEDGNFENINQINHMRNNTSSSNPNNYGANSPVDINGLVLTRSGADIRGTSVNVGANAKIVNGYNGTDVFANKSAADTVFEALVNANGIQAAANQISNDGTRIVIKSGEGANGINIQGQIANLNATEMAISNHGTNGLTVDGGMVASKGQLNFYNNTKNNTDSEMAFKNGAKAIAANLLVSSEGSLDVQSGTTLQATNKVEIVNENGQLKFAGTALGKDIDVRNAGADGMEITGTFGTTANKAQTVRFSNEKGALNFSGNVNSSNTASFWGQNTADGMTLAGTVNAAKGIRVENRAGNLALNGAMTVADGDLAVVNKGTGKLSTASGSNLTVTKGRLVVRNKATGGMELAGALNNNNGTTSVVNDAGAMAVGGTINNIGNLGISNKGTGAMTVSATVANTGTTKLINYKNGTGTGGMTISGKVTNTGADENDMLFVYNGKGKLQLTSAAALENKTQGDLFISSKENSTGVTTASGSVIKNTNGKIAITNKGVSSGAVNLAGTITGGTADVAINNYAGALNVGGNITADGNLGIINRGTDRNRGAGSTMTVDATIVANGANSTVNIKNNGTGAMTVGGDITHKGRLNVLANEGQLNLTGKVTNNGNKWSYFAARKNGTGINVANTFDGKTTAGGTMMIKNITGDNGLTYEGSMISTNGGQIEVYNKVGDLNVTGTAVMNAEAGTPNVILNTGNALTVSNDADLTITDDLRIVNKGIVSAKNTVGSKYNKYLKEQLKE